jgi:hypothetical protein
MAFAPLAGAALTAGGGGAAAGALGASIGATAGAGAAATAAAATWATGAMVATTVLTGAMALGAMASAGDDGGAPMGTEEPLDTTMADDMDLAKTRNTNLRRKLYGEERTNLLAEETQGTTEKTTLGA